MPKTPGSTLYLRGMPLQVVRRAKAEAAIRGITLAELISEALAEHSGYRGNPSGDRRAAVSSRVSLESDLDWYEQNKDRLLKRYENKHVAVKDGAVIDHEADFGALAARVFRKLGDVPVLMPLCTKSERVAKIRSPRVAR